MDTGTSIFLTRLVSDALLPLVIVETYICILIFFKQGWFLLYPEKYVELLGKHIFEDPKAKFPSVPPADGLMHFSFLGTKGIRLLFFCCSSPPLASSFSFISCFPLILTCHGCR